MEFYMPTRIFFSENCVKNNKAYFHNLGNKALVVTGKNSAKKNGSLDDVIEVLELNNIEYVIFDKVEENPSLENVREGADLGIAKEVDFVIGIGGGSPLDASKAIGILIKNPNVNEADLYTEADLKSLPIIAIATTAGTGSEVTPVSVLTNHFIKNKQSIKPKIFPKAAFLDVRYYMNTPYNITVATAVDAFSHLMESYLCGKSNTYSEFIAEKGMKVWGECIAFLKTGVFSKETRKKLIMVSTLGGIAISQTGTTLPHGLGYPLTYYHNIPHGTATAIFLPSYLEFHQNIEKKAAILNFIGCKDISEFRELINSLLGEITIEEHLITQYSKQVYADKRKTQSHPYTVTEEDVINIYKSSVKGK